MSAVPHLVVVVPESKIAAMTARGYRSTDRANGYTVTMYRRCDTHREAHELGYKLPFIWQVELIDTQ